MTAAAAQTDDPLGHAEGLKLDIDEAEVDKTLAALEMAGEEIALGWKPAAHRPLAAEVRFLHASRTIHQLIADRNRSVGTFLFVASLGFGASTALMNAPESARSIVPLGSIQYWCLPSTFATLGVIGVFMSLILIRTRIGLIYEVAKMNALLGLPADRVKRVNPLSIFFLMHSLVATLGAAATGLAAGMLAHGVAIGVVSGLVYLIAFEAMYYLTVLRATTTTKLEAAKG